LHTTFTISNVGVITYHHSKLLENPSVTSGGYPSNHNILSFEAVGNPSVTSGGYPPNQNTLCFAQLQLKFWFHYSTSHSNSIVIIPFVQAARGSSTSRRYTTSRPNITKPCPSSFPQRRTDSSTSSSCTCWKILTPARASAPSNSPVPTLHLSRRRSGVSTLGSPQRQPPQRCRISAVCDEKYSSTLAILEETAGETFKVYMTRKIQG
jgi:hypothetical protein